MGMPALPYFTAEMVRALPDDGKRYEVVHGELLVTPAPRPLHQRIQMRLMARLAAYLAAHPVGELFAAPADISWGRDSLVQPDLFVVRQDEADTLDWARMKHLLLAIEVMSPASMRADRFSKRRLYQQARVPCYWIVNGEERHVEVWTPEAIFPIIERTQLDWHPDGGEALTISCAEVFAA